MSVSEKSSPAKLASDVEPTPEIRQDPISDRRVIFAPVRAARPNEYSVAPPPHATAPCPFCEGNEHLATPEIGAIRQPGTSPQTPGWYVRVVANKYPAMNPVPSAAAIAGSHPSGLEGIAIPAVGVHEVIVESPRHLKSITELNITELIYVLAMYRDRMDNASAHPAVRYAMVFKNVGPGAGASMEHLHSQLIGLPVVPPDITARLSAAKAYRQQHGVCYFCELLDRERKARLRLIEETGKFVVLCPYASRFPLEICLMPKAHESRFDRIPEADVPELAEVLRRCIERIERTTGQSEYNYLIHSAPFDTSGQGHYHWHIEIFPRLARTAGFEWGTGMFINSVFPEEAARKLREALS